MILNALLPEASVQLRRWCRWHWRRGRWWSWTASSSRPSSRRLKMTSSHLLTSPTLIERMEKIDAQKLNYSTTDQSESLSKTLFVNHCVWFPWYWGDFLKRDIDSETRSTNKVPGETAEAKFNWKTPFWKRTLEEKVFICWWLCFVSMFLDFFLKKLWQ